MFHSVYVRLLLLIALTFSIAACSNRAVYESVQHHNSIECSKLPQVQYEECMQEIDQSYDDYEREHRGSSE